MPKRLRGFFSMMRPMVPAPLLLAVLLLTPLASPGGDAAPAGAAPHAVLKYFGHSCFQVTTPAGIRLVIDPFSSGEWPGLALPYVEADWVLVTHPHWDHDAWKPVRGDPKRIDGPGVTARDDFVVRGIEGRHADLGGAAIGYRNTIYVIETGGVRICHPGDNGPITEALTAAVGKVDVLLLPVDSEHRVLTLEQARGWVEALSPRAVVPMHYRVEGLSPQNVSNLGTVYEWAASIGTFTRLPGDLLTLDPATLPLPGTGQAILLTLPGERPQDAASAPGRLAAAEARKRGEIAAAEGDLVTALDQFSRAAELDPADADLLQKVGFLQMGSRRPDRAVEFFARAVKAAGGTDRRAASLAWLGTGMALDLLGRRREAIAAYGEVVKLGLNDENQTDQARRYAETPYSED